MTTLDSHRDGRPGTGASGMAPPWCSERELPGTTMALRLLPQDADGEPPEELPPCPVPMHRRRHNLLIASAPFTAHGALPHLWRQDDAGPAVVRAGDSAPGMTRGNLPPPGFSHEADYGLEGLLRRYHHHPLWRDPG